MSTQCENGVDCLPQSSRSQRSVWFGSKTKRKPKEIISLRKLSEKSRPDRQWLRELGLLPIGHHTLHVAVEQWHGETVIAVRGAVDHSFADPRCAGRGNSLNFLAQQLCDVARFMRTRPKLGYRPQISLFRRGEPIKAPSEKAVVGCATRTRIHDQPRKAVGKRLLTVVILSRG